MFKKKTFNSYWFESGTPTFLIELIHENNYPVENLDNLTVMKSAFETFKVLFADIKYDMHVKNEKYYQTIFFLTFKLIGVHVEAEIQTNIRRIDATIILDNHIYLFEFKIDKTAKDAMDQIRNQKYYEKYLLENKPITLVGVNFSSTDRTVEKWITEVVDS